MVDRRHSVMLPVGTVKIDGLRDPEHAAAAAAAGADVLGFVFAPTRRRVDAATARICLEAARQHANQRTFLAVGVFVDPTRAEVEAAIDGAGLDIVQIHGDGLEADFKRYSRPVIRPLNPKPGTPTAVVAERIAEVSRSSTNVIGFIIDGYRAGEHGGTGVRADWELVREVAQQQPVILAGGLDPDNVEAAIATVGPFGVDVSSGVETDGVKDAAKIEAFVRRAKRGFAKLRS